MNSALRSGRLAGPAGWREERFVLILASQRTSKQMAIEHLVAKKTGGRTERPRDMSSRYVYGCHTKMQCYVRACHQGQAFSKPQNC